MSRGRPNEQDRTQRVPLGVARKKLTSDQRPGYVRRWVNDTAGRLDAAENGGYQFVTKARVGDVPGDTAEQAGIGNKVSRVVGKDESGQPITAYLMEIKQEWYDQDQQAKQNRIKDQEKDIRRGKDEHGEPGRDTRYTSTDTSLSHRLND